MRVVVYGPEKGRPQRKTLWAHYAEGETEAYGQRSLASTWKRLLSNPQLRGRWSGLQAKQVTVPAKGRLLFCVIRVERGRRSPLTHQGPWEPEKWKKVLAWLQIWKAPRPGTGKEVSMQNRTTPYLPGTPG